MMNEIKRYELLYTTLAKPYHAMALAGNDAINSLAAKEIAESNINYTARSRFAWNLHSLRAFVGS